MEAIAEFPALRSSEAPRKRSKESTPSLAAMGSLCLHLGLLLLLIWAVPHQQGALLTKKAFTVIALQTLQAAPTPTASTSVVPPSPPHHHPRPAAAKPVAIKTWQAPPTPLPAPPPPALAQAPAPPTDPAPPAPTPVVTASSEPSPAPPSAAGSAAQSSFYPLAYLTQVSRIINYTLKAPSGTQRSGMNIAVVHIRIDRDGTVLEASLIQSSGYRELDEEALAVVARIHQFPAPPGDTFPFTIDQPIRFRSA